MPRKEYTDRPNRNYGTRRSGRREPEGLKNQKMSPEVYEKRRKVINAIYDAKKLVKNVLGVELPRISARIVDIDPQSVVRKNAVGTARMGTNEIWIPEETVNGKYERYLKEIVFHEILHAAYRIDHDESCPLMSANLKGAPLSDDEINKCFINQIKKVI